MPDSSVPSRRARHAWALDANQYDIAAHLVVLGNLVRDPRARWMAGALRMGKPQAWGKFEIRVRNQKKLKSRNQRPRSRDSSLLRISNFGFRILRGRRIEKRIEKEDGLEKVEIREVVFTFSLATSLGCLKGAPPV
jgi:hypothetical protein